MWTIFTSQCGWRSCFNFSTHCFARVKGTFWMCANACRPKRDRTGETQKVNESNASLENATPSTRTRMLETKRYWAPTVLFFKACLVIPPKDFLKILPHFCSSYNDLLQDPFFTLRLDASASCLPRYCYHFAAKPLSVKTLLKTHFSMRTRDSTCHQ